MNMEIDPNLLPELKDIINRIKAFNATHPEGLFLYHFLGFKKSDEICEDCGGHCDGFDPNKSMLGAFGDIDTLRMMSNDLRDLIEDNKDVNDFVNF